MGRLMTMVPPEGLTVLLELPAVIKNGEVIVPPRPEFMSAEGLQKLKSLAATLDGSVVYWKFRGTLNEMDYATCVERDCYHRVDDGLYCKSHSHSRKETVHPRANLRPVSGN